VAVNLLVLHFVHDTKKLYSCAQIALRVIIAVEIKDVKWLPGTRPVTGFQNEHPVIKKFKVPQYAFVY